jgi:hypothetical protein
MLNLGLGIKRTLAVCVSLCLFIPWVVPSLAIGCEGGGGGGANFSMAPKNHAIIGTGEVEMTITNISGVEAEVKSISALYVGDKTVWSFNDKPCIKKYAKGGTCPFVVKYNSLSTAQVTFQAQDENGHSSNEATITGEP